MRRRAFTLLAATFASAGIFACVTSSSSPGGPPSFDGSFPDALGSSGGTDATDALTTTPEASADAADAADAGSTLRWVYVAGALVPESLPDGGYNAGVYGFAADIATGSVTAIDTDAVTPGFQASVHASAVPRYALATPDGRYLYASGSIPPTTAIFEFAVDHSSGALTPIGTVANSFGNDVVKPFVVDPPGKHLLLVDILNSAIHVFDILADGTLKEQVTTYPIPTGVEAISLSPSGEFLFTSSSGTGTPTSSFSVDTATGALSNRHDIATPTQPFGVIHHPSKQVVYTLSTGNALVNALAYDGTGAFTALSTKPSLGYGGMVDPTGSYLLVPEFGAVVLNAFPLDPTTGDLGAPIASDGGVPLARNVTIDPSGRAVFAGGMLSVVGNALIAAPLVSVWTVGNGGKVTPNPSTAPEASETAFSGPIVIVR